MVTCRVVPVMGFVRVTGVEGTATEKELACEDLKVKLSAEISALAGQTVEEVATVPLGRIVKFCVWEALQNVPKFSVAFSSCANEFPSVISVIEKVRFTGINLHRERYPKKQKIRYI